MYKFVDVLLSNKQAAYIFEVAEISNNNIL